MSILNIVFHPDPLLRETSQVIDEVNDSVRQLARDMFETMDAHQGIGLAAPQVGILDRILVVGVKSRRLVLINPELLSVDGSEEMAEGCLSIPNIHVDVTRPSVIRVRALDEFGQVQEYQESGLLARVIQHEMDHLNGVLIIDKGPAYQDDGDV